jgi:hypothetical protein
MVVLVGAVLVTLTLGLVGAPPALATGWSIQPSPSPPRIQNGGLGGGVSCASPTACMAVGSYSDRAGVQAPLAELWDGTSWSIVPMPDPPGSDFSVLGGVSCVSSTFCVAVGYYDQQTEPFGVGGLEVPLAELWDGTSWSIQPVPSSGGSGTQLSAVSCASSTSCTAVGEYGVPEGGNATLAEHWDGVSWSIQPTETPAVDTFGLSLTGVSCPTATFCLALGRYESEGVSLGTVVEQWDGASWSIQPNSVNGGLTDVSCTSATACTAVGHHCSCSPDTPLVERWDTSGWSEQSTPAVTNAADANLFAVSCTSSTCTAVGNFDDGGTGVGESLVEHWDGTAWSIEPTPSPGGATQTYLRGVSCASPTACTAVGEYNDPAGIELTLADGLNNGAASIELTPNPSGPTRSTLTGVSCASTTTCVAVGTGNTVPLVETWNRGNWSMLSTGVPTIAELAAVSCVSPIACTAVGGQEAARWNGRRWSVQQIPNLAGPLDEVSCASKTACTAIAAYSCGDCLRVPSKLPLAARWGGRSWSVQRMSHQAGTVSGLQGVSCPSTRSCTAVGGGTVERWNGRRWTPTPGRGPLQALACTSATLCTAVGSLINNGQRILVERWNGVRWSTQRTPRLVGAAQGSLTGISCAGPRACTAVGAYARTVGQEQPLVEHWNGVRWSIQPTPVPAGATTGSLISVSCALATACTAVGSYVNSDGDQLTLVERWHRNR